MKSRIHLIILFLAVILVVLAQATNMAETRLLAESLRWSESSRTTLQIRYLLRLPHPGTSTEGEHQKVKEKILRELDQLKGGAPGEIDEIKIVIDGLSNWGPADQPAIEIIEGRLLALATTFNQNESIAWSQSRRYGVLSRISWFSFAFITTLLIYWNVSLRSRVEKELQQRDIQVTHQIEESTEDLKQEIHRLNQLLEKLRE